MLQRKKGKDEKKKRKPREHTRKKMYFHISVKLCGKSSRQAASYIGM